MKLSAFHFISVIFRMPATLVTIFLLLNSINAQSTWYSELVGYSGNRLVYSLDSEGNKIPDFSYAGYRNGDEAIPDIPVVLELYPIEGDNTTHIQSAINTVSNMSADINGIRGAVFLHPGVYPVNGSLYIRKSGVVLRGAGDYESPEDNSIIQATGNIPSNRTVIKVGSTSVSLWGNGQSNIMADIVSDSVMVGDFRFEVDDASDFKIGDNIIIVHPCTETWLDAIDHGGTHSNESGAVPGVDIPWEPNSHPIYFNRNIIAIDNNTITIDAPVFDHIIRGLSQSYIYKYNNDGLIKNSGVEGLRVQIENSGPYDENHAKNGIVMYGVEDSWIKNCTVTGFILSGFETGMATRVTIENCKALDPSSKIEGGKRYNFNLYRYSQLILIKDSHASNGRHHYVSNGASTTSGCVFLNCTSSGAYAGSEGHRSWSQGLLYDNHKELDGPRPGLNARLLGLYNRGHYGTSHGWGTTHSVAWNCDVANGYLIVQKPPTGQNYAIGCTGAVISGKKPYSSFEEPEGWIEGINQNGLTPQSLYYAQLEDRWLTVPGFTVDIALSGKGNVTVSPQPVNGKYDSSSIVTFVAEPDSHWVFRRWEGDLSSTNNPELVTISKNLNVTAVFDSITEKYQIHAGIKGGGRIERYPDYQDGLYDSSMTVVLEAIPDPHWEFYRWSGDTISNEPIINIIMDSTVTVIAEFDTIEAQYVLDIYAEGKGSILASPEAIGGTYDSSETVVLFAKPDQGWEFKEWAGDLSGTSPVDSIVMHSNLTIGAIFDSIPIGRMHIDTSMSILAAVDYMNTHDQVDTLILTTPGGIYSFDGASSLMIKSAITVMASEDLVVHPVIKYNGSSGIEALFTVQSDFMIDGVELSGHNDQGPGLKYAVRLSAEGNTGDLNGVDIGIKDCIISDFDHENTGYGLKFDAGIKAGNVIIAETIFSNIGQEAVSIAETENWSTFTSLDSLSITNCTFYSIGSYSIHYTSDILPFSVDAPVFISDLTIDSCSIGSIFLKNSNGSTVRNIIISNSIDSEAGSNEFLIDAQGDGSSVSHICLFNTNDAPILSTGGTVEQGSIYNIDPQYQDAGSHNYTLSVSSQVFGIGYNNTTPGDDRWETESPLIVENSKNVPDEFWVGQNYPNPFNGETSIKLYLPEDQFLNLSIYDISGKTVKTLVAQKLSKGDHIIKFSSNDLPTGIYLYRVETDNYHSVKKFTLLK